MQLVLLILKIVGVILLILLTLVLSALLLILFVPVRYRFQGRWDEIRKGSIQISWLLHLLCLRGGYEAEEGLWYRISLCGFSLSDSRREEKTEKKEDGTKASGRAEQAAAREEILREEKASGCAEEKLDREGSGGTDPLPGEAFSDGAAPRQTAEPPRPPEKEKPRVKKWKPSLKTRFLEKKQKLKQRLLQIIQKLQSICGRINQASEFVKREENQASFRLLFHQSKKLIAHLWPKKGKGTVVFGFDDPYTTGQLVAAASMLYPFYYEHLTLRPDFEDPVFKADGFFSGRIRIASLLWIAFGVWRHKHTRQMILKLLK